MKKAFLTLFLMLFAVSFSFAPHAEQGDDLPLFLYDPCISPDGSTIAFEYQGDLWTVPVVGGEAKRLTLHMAMERRPLFSPDGKWIVYAANYFGDLNLFIMPATGGSYRRLTFGPTVELPSAWSADGKHIYYYGANDGNFSVYRVAAEGGTPVKIAGALLDPVVGACPSPDNSKVVFTFRHDYSGLSRQGNKTHYSAELYIADNTLPVANIKRLTNNMYQDFLPTFSADGSSVYFLSDRDGVYNLYSMSPNGDTDAKQISKFTDIGIRWYSISNNGAVVISRNRRIHILDKATGEAKLVEIKIYSPAKMEVPDFSKQPPSVSDFSVSPDNKKIAFISHHDIYVMGADGGYAKQFTNTAEREMDIFWAKDSVHIYFTRIVGNAVNIFQINTSTGEEKALTTGAGNKQFPRMTRDGKHLFYHLDYNEVIQADADCSNPKTIVKADFPINPLRDSGYISITQDGKWLLYSASNDAMFLDIYAKKIGTDDSAIKMTHFGGHNTTAFFTPDYKHFLYNCYTVNPDGNYSLAAYVIDLEVDKKTKPHPKEELEALLNPPQEEKKPEEGEKQPDGEGKQEKKEGDKVEQPAKKVPGDSIDFSDLQKKVRMLFTRASGRYYVADYINSNVVMVGVETSPMLFNLFLVSLDPESEMQPMQLTNVKSSMTAYGLDDSRSALYYVENGELYRYGLKTRKLDKLTPATITRTFSASAMRLAVFGEIMWLLDFGFYDPKHHGVKLDYIRARYLPLVEKCTTDREFYSLVDDVFGEMNASHLSFGGGSILPDVGRIRERKPHLGFEYDSALMEKGILKITDIIEGTPAAKPNSGLKAGDFVLEINGQKIAPSVNIHSFIRNSLGDDLELRVADNEAGENARTVFLPTINVMAYFNARLDAWEEGNRQYVYEKSEGKFGYIWVRDMMNSEYRKFIARLNTYMADYDGVIIDFRYNSGGFTAGRIAEMLDDTPWLFSKLRGTSWVPEDYHRRGLSFQKANCGLFNYACFSNAEMMCAAYRLKKLGPSVGMPTAGGVIGTSPVELLDGSSMGLPSNRVEDFEGRNLELSPTEPEFIVDRDIADILANRDPQLDRGIEELRKEVPRKKAQMQPKSGE